MSFSFGALFLMVFAQTVNIIGKFSRMKLVTDKFFEDSYLLCVNIADKKFKGAKFEVLIKAPTKTAKIVYLKIKYVCKYVYTIHTYLHMYLCTYVIML